MVSHNFLHLAFSYCGTTSKSDHVFVTHSFNSCLWWLHRQRHLLHFPPPPPLFFFFFANTNNTLIKTYCRLLIINNRFFSYLTFLLNLSFESLSSLLWGEDICLRISFLLGATESLSSLSNLNFLQSFITPLGPGIKFKANCLPFPCFLPFSLPSFFSSFI